MEDERYQMLLWLILPCSGTALTLGCRKHKDRFALFAGGLGLLVLVGTAITGHNLLGEYGERIANLVGTLILAWSHVRNYSLCRTDNCDHRQKT